VIERRERRGTALALALVLVTMPAAAAIAGTPAPDDDRRIAAGPGDSGRRADPQRGDSRASAPQRLAYVSSEGKRRTADPSEAGAAEQRDSPQGDTGKREGRGDSGG